MHSIIQVFLGGMIGTSLRYIIGLSVSSILMLLIVNILGSFLLGIFSGYYEKRQTTKMKLLFTTGLLGSFTTFSSFSEQWFLLLKENVVLGLCYGIGMLICCITAAFIGYKLSR